jgi:RNA polymerase sigma-70 factor (ECF subfamily)
LGVWPSDADLVRRARDGDPAAFEALVDRHYPDCLRYAFRMLGDRADAEEAVQDAFVRAHRSLGRYREQDRFRVWLLRILANRCRTRAAATRRRLRLLDAFAASMDGKAVAPQANGGFGRAVQRALAALPPEQREAFLLKHVEELSYEEIARITGAGLSALRMRVKRARERLAALLEEYRDD